MAAGEGAPGNKIRKEGIQYVNSQFTQAFEYEQFMNNFSFPPPPPLQVRATSAPPRELPTAPGSRTLTTHRRSGSSLSSASVRMAGNSMASSSSSSASVGNLSQPASNVTSRIREREAEFTKTIKERDRQVRRKDLGQLAAAPDFPQFNPSFYFVTDWQAEGSAEGGQQAALRGQGGRRSGGRCDNGGATTQRAGKRE